MQAGLADLPEDGLALLRGATCFPEGGDVRALVEVAGLGSDSGAAAVAELLDRGLLTRADGTDRLRLLGPIRDAVLTRTDAEALRTAHAAAIAYYDGRYCCHEWFDRRPSTAEGSRTSRSELDNLRTVLAIAADLRSPRLPRMVARLAWAATLLSTGATWRRWRDIALGCRRCPTRTGSTCSSPHRTARRRSTRRTASCGGSATPPGRAGSVPAGQDRPRPRRRRGGSPRDRCAGRGRGCRDGRSRRVPARPAARRAADARAAARAAGGLARR